MSYQSTAAISRIEKTPYSFLKSEVALLFFNRRESQREAEALYGIGSFLPVIAAAGLLVVARPASTTEVISKKLATQISFDIPSQPLSSALRVLAGQAGIQILFEERVVQGRAAPPIRTRQTAFEILHALLDNTGLEFTAKEDTVAVREKKLSDAKTDSENPSQDARVVRVAEIREFEVNTGHTTGVAIEEVIVTAERREESAQKVALPLTVISGKDLREAGVVKPEDLNKLVPGLKMTNGNITSIYVRGVGEVASYPSTQSAVAFSVDGYYVGRSTAVAPNFYDLQRMEILKGPQGTLYGRNATGGAVNAITNKPTDEFGGYANVDVGDYDLRRITAVLNVPVSDTLAFRGALYSSQRDGYLSDGWQDDDTQSGRLLASWRPTDNVSTLWSFDASQQKGRGDGGVIFDPVTGITDIGGQNSPQAIGLRTAKGNVQALLLPSELRTGPGIDFDSYSTSVQVDWDLNFATLTFQPGYRHHDWFYLTYSTFGSVVSSGESAQYSGEIRLANQGDKLKYVVGLFYFNEDLQDYKLQVMQFLGGGTVRNLYDPIREFSTDSRAAFGEATFSLTDRFRVTAGVRYTHESREVDMQNNGWGTAFSSAVTGADTQPDPVTGVVTGHYSYRNLASPTWENTSGKFGIEFDLRPQSMLYAHVASGFKSGGFSLSPAPQDVYKPETLTAYTVGVKNRFIGDSLQLNLELFDWTYKNQQISHLGYDINGAATFITENAGKSSITGAELDVIWRATRVDTLGLRVQYIDAVYDEYSVLVPFPDASGCVFTPTVVNGRNIFLQNCSGFPMPFTPDYAGTASYSHEFSLGSLGSLTFRTVAQFSTDFRLAVDNRPAIRGDSYITPDIDLTYRTPNRAFSIMGYVRNASDEVITNAVSINNQNANIRPPRTYGMQFNLQF